MKTVLRILLTFFAAALILGATVLGLRASRKPVATTAVSRPPVPVRIAPVGRTNLVERLILNGSVDALYDVEIRPKISGRLARLVLDDGSPIEEGVRVKAGALIAELEHDDLDAAVTQASAAVQTARAAVTAARVVRADAERERRRAESLFAQGTITEQARDRAVTADEQAAAALDQAIAHLAQAEAALQAAEVTRREAFLRAPFDGLIAARYVDPGAIVSPSTPLLRLVHTDTVRIRCAIPSRYLPDVTGRTVQAHILVDVRPDRPLTAELNAIYPAVDKTLRTATLEFRVPNPPDDPAPLKPGLYASVRLPLNIRNQTLAVPSEAIIRILDRSIVYVAEGQTARAREVTLGIREGNLVEILQGLAEGEPMVVMGQHRLTDGAPIRILSAEHGEETP